MRLKIVAFSLMLGLASILGACQGGETGGEIEAPAEDVAPADETGGIEEPLPTETTETPAVPEAGDEEASPIDGAVEELPMDAEESPMEAEESPSP
ncbi:MULTISPECIES: hypothetical protein [unclassified Coleofasciculus]|uniref:hypothetical protein n=1 Tax=unclassified Coleofasciculus TaxID=2692782 RepID=UPI0018812964|nr:MULTISPECIES: hypothetical protein [unclassified Coleofasciculus]MBE9126171.1 hypothetical protein [Coleofasciculus sp. LEGE 07081]MBE9149622.1 hypothetical protein [Coleofasciculus sp. LEGE 07092]